MKLLIEKREEPERKFRLLLACVNIRALTQDSIYCVAGQSVIGGFDATGSRSIAHLLKRMDFYVEV